MEEVNEFNVKAELKLPIKRVVPNGMLAVKCDHVLIQNSGDDFTLGFYQLQSPDVVTADEMAQIESIEARCIARVTVNPKKMGEIVSAFKKALSNYEKAIADVEQKDSNVPESSS
jgi:hypothetical protein